MNTLFCYNFLIFTGLTAPVILAFIFSNYPVHGLILDFTKLTIQICPKQDDIQKHLEYCSTTKVPHTMIAAIRESSTDITMDCAIPGYETSSQYELPECRSALFSEVITQYNKFQWNPSKTDTIGEITFVVYKEVSFI